METLEPFLDRVDSEAKPTCWRGWGPRQAGSQHGGPAWVPAEPSPLLPLPRSLPLLPPAPPGLPEGGKPWQGVWWL